MEKTNKPVDRDETLSRSDLLDLYKHYWSVILAELGFCHQYLNFYSGLLSAILAATLAGLLSIKFRGLDELALLLGPLLMVVFAYNGYRTVQAFYRRFAEAWVTAINLESILQIRFSPQDIELGYEPIYSSTEKSFIPTYDFPKLKKIFELAKEKKWKAEEVAKELGKKGTTLTNARSTFIYRICGITIQNSASYLVPDNPAVARVFCDDFQRAEWVQRTILAVIYFLVGAFMVIRVSFGVFAA